jgi:hypothetical protein
MKLGTIKSEPLVNHHYPTFSNPQYSSTSHTTPQPPHMPKSQTPVAAPPPAVTNPAAANFLANQFPLMPAFMNHFIANSAAASGNTSSNTWKGATQCPDHYTQHHNPYAQQQQQLLQQAQTGGSQQAAANPFQQIQSAFLNYFQAAAHTKAAQQQSTPSYFNPSHFAHHHHHHHVEQPQAQFNTHQFNNYNYQYIEDFKRASSTHTSNGGFANYFQEAAGFGNKLMNAATTSSNKVCGNTSGNSSCSDSLDSLKETQLKISESTNLVNESN